MTENENTLQIKEFAGIDRFNEGTVTPPNQFFTIQNMHPINKGEIASVGGVEAQVAPATMPGVDRFIHTEFHVDKGGVSRLLAFFKPSITGASDFGTSLITAAQFTYSNSGATDNTFLVVLIGSGGAYKSVLVTGNTSGVDPTVTFTVPNGLPAWICQINIYFIQGTYPGGPAGLYNWPLCASVSRRYGTFPTSVTFIAVSNSTSNQTANMPIPNHFSVRSYATGGELQENRIYYLGVAANSVCSASNTTTFPFPRIRLTDTQNSPITLFIPSGYTKATGRFYWGAELTGTYGVKSGGNAFRRLWGFLGTSPEDVLNCSYKITESKGAYSPLALTEEKVGWDNIAVNGTFDYLLSSFFNFNDESPVVYTGPTASGFTQGAVYWVKHVFFGSTNEIRLATSYANLKAGTFLDITTAPTTSASFFLSQVFCDMVFDHVPHNSNNGVDMVANYVSGGPPSVSNPRILGGPDQEADSTRSDGAFINSMFWPKITATDEQGLYYQGSEYFQYPLGSDSSDHIGCWVFESFPYSSSNAYQLVANINSKNFSLTGQQKVLNSGGLGIPAPSPGSILIYPTPSPSLLWNNDKEQLSTKQFTLRTYVANGDNSLFYTNGYVLKPIIRSDGKARIPTCSFVTAFQNRLFMAGGPQSFQNSPNQGYYSEADDPFNWGVSINTLNFFTPEEISGLGAYSQNLLDSGFNDFLILSKKDSLFVWDGNIANGPKQIYYKFGFASPNSFCVTDFGPVFISRDNAYTIQGENIVDIGDQIKPILDSLNENQLSKINCVFHQNKMKISYPSTDGGDNDRELWLELRSEEGGIKRFWSGPHVLKEIKSQAATLEFNGERDVRVSVFGDQVFQRDTGTTDNAADIEHKIIISRLGMQQDHFWKLVNQIYLALKISQNETISFIVDSEDGSSQYTGSTSILIANGARQLLQYFLTSRVRSRIAKLTISCTSDGAISLYDVSLLFENMRRRKLR